MVEIAQEPTGIIEDPREYMMMIYGTPGAGKTTFGANILGHYFLRTEHGTEGVVTYGHAVRDWKEFAESCGQLVKQKTDGFKDVREVSMIVIDTYEVLLNFAGKFICENEVFLERGSAQRFQNIDDVPFGKGYKRASDKVVSALLKLKGYGFGVLLLSHEKERVTKWKGREITYYAPDLTPTSASLIHRQCGAVGYMTIDEEVTTNEDTQEKNYFTQRRIFFQPQPTRMAKHRLAGFPAYIDVQDKNAWKEYEKAFKETLEKTKTDGTER